MSRTDRNRLTNLYTNVSVYLGVCELFARSSKDIGHPQILALVLAVLSQALPCNHDRNRRFGNKVVTERAKQHTATISRCIRDGRGDLPFESVTASGPKNDKGGFEHIDLSSVYQ